jgi:osmotically-inducible protein OsmY
MEMTQMDVRKKSLADRDLEQRVANYLFNRRKPTSRRIDVKVVGGTVTLCGRVRSFYERQLCIHCCQRVAGVRGLVDRIEVEDADREQENA